MRTMPSDKPRVQIRFEEDDWQVLENWAAEDFITLPQLCKSIILRAIANKTKPGEKKETNKK